MPEVAHIQSLACWIGGLDVEVHESSALATYFDQATNFSDAAGVLAISVSQIHRHQIIWFRPELVQRVKWAGDSRKAALNRAAPYRGTRCDGIGTRAPTCGSWPIP
ncbi:MAG: hypothetical protein ACRYGA_08185 [Janthinobacterium lividum]